MKFESRALLISRETVALHFFFVIVLHRWCVSIGGFLYLNIMIEESQYNLPRRKTNPAEPTEAERRKAAETLEYLENLPWRPHGEEW